DVIFSILDDLYPEMPASDRLGEVMRACLRRSTDKNEEANAYTARAVAVFSDAEREGIILTDIAAGIIMLEGCQLELE
ncbi:unnamed protein product, partial [Prorocentrum cordatum]